MTDQKAIHLCLGKLVQEMIDLEDGSWSPVSILHRVMTEGAVNRSNKPGDRILCKESSREARFVAPAFAALPMTDKFIVIVKHMPPPKPDKKWTDREKAQWLGEKLHTFRTRYTRILKKVQRHLTV
jgi:hypothetical protein